MLLVGALICMYCYNFFFGEGRASRHSCADRSPGECRVSPVCVRGGFRRAQLHVSSPRKGSFGGSCVQGNSAGLAGMPACPEKLALFRGSGF